MTRKISIIIFILITLVMGMGAALTSCDNESKPAAKPNLTGTAKIKGTMEVGETVEAEIAGSNGTAGKFTYKWTKTKDGGQALEITGANGATYKITEGDVDHVLGAIIGNDDTLGTISGAAASAVAKNQTATITNLFGEGFSATVKGTLTNAEWNGVADKIETALNGAFVDGIVPVKNRFKAVFGQTGGVTIIVEKTTAYDNWKTTADGLTLYVNFDALDNIQSILPNAMLAMEGKYVQSAQVKKQNRVRFGGGMSAFELAQATQSNRHRNHLVYHCT